MELITPGIGLVFWMLLSFMIIVWILKKFAWKPILEALKERENSIANSLSEAEKARKEMANLQADNELIVAKAKMERNRIIKEAKTMGDNVIEEAKEKAGMESAKIINAARVSIENEKNAAMNEIKNQISNLSVEIAEKILRQELSKKGEHEQLIDAYIKDAKLN